MKTKTLQFFGFCFLFLICMSCSRKRFLTSDYPALAPSHKTIAVLPYQVTLMGRVNQKLSSEERDELIKLDSDLYQQDLYGEILRRSGLDDGDVDISIQDLLQTNKILADQGITAANIGEHSGQEMGQLLGVDAVVFSRVITDQFMSRTESALANVAASVLTQKDAVPFIPGNILRSSEVDIQSKIVDVKTGKIVWSIHTDCNVNWQSDNEDAVQRINERISRNFPYRKKDR